MEEGGREVLLLLGVVVVEAAEFAVEGELLLGEEGELGVVGAAFGFGDEDAQVAQFGLDGAFFDLLDGALDFDGLGGLGLGKEGFGEESALGGVFDDVHGVVCLAISEGKEGWSGTQLLEPGGLLEDGLGGEAAGIFAVGVGDGEGAEEDTLDFSEGGHARFDVVAAF
jgi:hypothetical protein